MPSLWPPSTIRGGRAPARSRPLWASDDEHAEYRAFAASMLPYALPHWAEHYRDWTAKPSISGGEHAVAIDGIGTEMIVRQMERIQSAGQRATR